MLSAYLSVDLGGTSLRMALLDENGRILSQQNISSDLVREAPDLLKVLSQETELFRFRAEKVDREILGMALGIPGLVDSERGIVRQSPHFPRWKDIHLRETLQKEFSFPVLMENDANQAALGESWKGAGVDWRDFILLTLGTGIGGGIILNGEIYHGPTGFAGEVGHIVLERRGGIPGALGSRGTLETLASQSGLRLQLDNIKKTGETALLPESLSNLDSSDPTLPEKLSTLAKAGEKQALEIWREFGEALGCGIASIGLAFGFNHFVIGGGLAGAWKFFEEAMQKEIRLRTYSCLSDEMTVIPAKLGKDAGLLGGVRLIQTTQLSS